MEQKTEKESLIVRYLIGGLSEEEREKLEDHYFKDDGFFEEVVIVEEDLIDDYLGGRLTKGEREQFERHYLNSPARRERVEFSKSMMTALASAPVSDTAVSDAPASDTQVTEAQASEAPVSDHAAPDPPARLESRSWFRSLFGGRNLALQFALGAAMLVIAAGAAWLLFENTRLRNEIIGLEAERAAMEQREKERAGQAEGQRERERELQAQVESEQSQRRQLEQQLAQSQPPPPTIFELASNATRSNGAAKTLSIPSGAKTVELRLYVEPGDYSSYRAVLQTAEGERVWSKAGLKARASASGKVVTVSLPAQLLSGRDYVLMLAAAAGRDYDDVGEYYFKVVKK